MGHFVEFDHREVSKDLDITAWNSYPLGNLQNIFHNAVQLWLYFKIV